MAKAPSKFSGGLRKKRKSAAAAKGGSGVKAQTPASRSQRRSGERKKIGQVLIDLGFINEEQLWQVLEHAKQTGELTGQAAVSLQFITKEIVTQALAEQQGLPTIDLSGGQIMPPKELLSEVPEAMCQLYKVFPIKKVGNTLTVAMADPTNIEALDDLRNMLSVDEVTAMVAGEEEVLASIEQAYQGQSTSIMDIINEMESDDDDLDSLRNRTGSIDLDSLEEMANEAPVRKLLNMVLLLAIRDKASDVHFEPFEDEFKMRYRVDGVMYEMVPPPRHLAPAIASRIKVMADLDIAERRIPQDGRIELSIGGAPVDLRVSVLPTMFGEGVVMRVLDRSVVSLDLEKIGMPPYILEGFRELIERPHGIVLVTGPTGSGKTTTLYSALNHLNQITEKIITTEDPIEYDIDGIIQVPINSDIGVTFASSLRAILRQDPDIILVGEIRDFETAQIAIQSSLTGHLVFSTLHTNDAPSSVIRLRDMGVQPFLITATVEGILAQRLVRKICPNCREQFKPSQEMLLELSLSREQAAKYKFFQGKGCDVCNNTGHKGRGGIFELFHMNDEIRDLIAEGAHREPLVEAGVRNGMIQLREAGLNALSEGFTTIDEIVRETVLDEDF